MREAVRCAIPDHIIAIVAIPPKRDLIRQRWLGVAALSVLVCHASEARADITAFLGVSPTPSTRSVRGVAAGGGLVIVGFEIEGFQVRESVADTAPSLTAGTINGLVQTPLDVSRMQFYGTAGVGLYRETLGARQETSALASVGGGVKVRLTGPLKLRLDYRLLRLRGAPLHAMYHRVYAGATLGF
jgi:opacity protein-like surface antigen